MVVNGSATPKVIGVLSPGSGALAMSSSRLFCQKQSAEGDAVRDDRDDYARTKLVEMFDERKPVLEIDRP